MHDMWTRMWGELWGKGTVDIAGVIVADASATSSIWVVPVPGLNVRRRGTKTMSMYFISDMSNSELCSAHSGTVQKIARQLSRWAQPDTMEFRYEWRVGTTQMTDWSGPNENRFNDSTKDFPRSWYDSCAQYLDIDDDRGYYVSEWR